MKGLIRTIRCRYKLFKQPDQVGDVLEMGGEHLLIIGIEKFDLIQREIIIWFTCQNLSLNDYIAEQQTATSTAGEVELTNQMKYDDERWSDYSLGSTFVVKGNRYKLIEYTEISLKGTDLYVSTIAKRVYPINRKEAKSKFIHERRKKLKLEVH